MVLSGSIEPPSGQLYQVLFRFILALASVAAVVVALLRHPFYPALFWIGVGGAIVFGGLTVVTVRLWRPAFVDASTRLAERMTRLTSSPA